MLLDAAPPTIVISGCASAKTEAGGVFVRAIRGPAISIEFQNIQTGTGVGTGEDHAGIVFDGTYFVRVGNSTNSHKSSDGLTWTSNFATGAATFNSQRLISANTNTGTIIATYGSSASLKLQRSTDHGVTWAATGDLPSSAVWVAGYGNGIWIAVPGTTTGGSAISYDDGLTWSAGGAMPFTPTFGFVSVVYGNGIFLATSSYDANAAISVDGLVWKSVPTGSNGGFAVYSTSKKIFVIGDPNNTGVYFGGSGQSFYRIVNKFSSGSMMNAVGNWLTAGYYVTWTPETGMVNQTGTEMNPMAYGNGYYVQSFSWADCKRMTEPVITYATRIE